MKVAVSEISSMGGVLQPGGEESRDDTATPKWCHIVQKHVPAEEHNVLSIVTENHHIHSPAKRPREVFDEAIVGDQTRDVEQRLVDENAQPPTSPCEDPVEEGVVGGPEGVVSRGRVVGEVAAGDDHSWVESARGDVVEPHGDGSRVCSQGDPGYAGATVVGEGGVSDGHVWTVVDVKDGFREVPAASAMYI